MKRIVLLTAHADYAWISYHALARSFPIAGVIAEERISSWQLFKGRIRRLGLARAIGQVLFRICIAPILAFSSRRRSRALMAEHGLAANPISSDLVTAVSTVNSEEAIAALVRLRPDVVVVVGTRIIGERVLSAVPAPFVNIHAGITPLYRGVHGGYWSLVERDPSHCGVTIHLLDKGIDTGGILAQVRIEPTPDDNFATYSVLQLATGLRVLCDQVLPRLLAGDTSTLPPPLGASRLWSHPTLWEYLRNRWRLGVR